MLLTMLNFLVVIFLWMQRHEHCATIFSLCVSWYLIVVVKEIPPLTLMDALLTIICYFISEQAYASDEAERKERKTRSMFSYDA